MTPSAPVNIRLALASERGESKKLFRQRNKKVVAAKTQERPLGAIISPWASSAMSRLHGLYSAADAR
jgi:hypothetical protein